MPIRYIEPINTPYVGINVDYFDKKALEKQQRHDLSRENYSQFVQGIASQPYLDIDSRNQYLQEQQRNFDEVINKHKGNLSAGYQDVLGAIEQSKLNPYHNVNKRAIEQDKIRQELTAEYGAYAIDKSNIPTKLYNRKEDGSLEWVNPNQISAKVIKADQYEKLFEDIAKDLKPQMASIESDLKRSNNPYYLQAVKTGNKGLLNEIMIDEYVKKHGIDSFIRASGTWAMDNRPQMGYNSSTGTNRWTKLDENGNIIPNRETLAQDLKSFIADKMTDNPFVDREFHGNTGLTLATQHANRLKADKAKIDYEQYVKNLYLGPLEKSTPIGAETITGAKLNETKENTLKAQQDLNSIKSQKNNVLKDFQNITGMKSSFMDYVKPDLSFDRDKAKQWLEVQGKNPNQINDLVDQMEISYKSYNGLRRQENELSKNIDESNKLLSGAANKIASDYINTLSQEDKTKLAKAGITSIEDFNKLSNELESKTISIFGKKVPFDIVNPFDSDNWNKKSDPNKTNAESVVFNYLNYRDDQYNKGVKLDVLENALTSDNPNSMVKVQNDLLTKSAQDVGFETYLQSAKTSDGKPLVQFYTDADKGSLKEWLENNEVDEKTSRLLMSTKNAGTNGLTSHIILSGKSKGGGWLGGTEKGTPSTYEIVNADLGNDNGLAKEIAARYAQQSFTLNDLSGEYNDKQRENAYNIYGSTSYGADVYDKVLAITDPYTSVGTTVSVPFSLENGEKSNVLLKKVDNGYVGIVGGNPNNKFHFDNPSNEEEMKQTIADMVRLTNTGIGKTTLLYGNEPFINSLKHYGTFGKEKLPSVYDNNKVVKSNTFPQGGSNYVPQGINEEDIEE